MLILCGTTLLGFVDSPGNAEQSVDTAFHALSLHGPMLPYSLADLGRGIPQVSLSLSGAKARLESFLFWDCNTKS